MSFSSFSFIILRQVTEDAMKIKRLSKIITFSALTTAGIYFLNNHINERAVSRHLLETNSGNYYKWKNLNV